jgi:MHS family alpha-ketoglutarate permease-like MFS transporter
MTASEDTRFAASEISVPRSAAQRLRSIFAGSVGNLVEWFDWYVYSATALYFSRSFFPQGDATAQLLNTAAVFALGFLMRPLGGLWMCSYADRHGRKSALTLAVVLMSAGSLIIALTPTYATIGVLAPAALVFARLLQGISVGGEYGISATYLSEVASRERRGFYSSFQYVTLIMGQLLAIALLVLLQRFLLTDEQLQAWGWRIPFAIGAVLAVVAFWLRLKMQESEAFVNSASRAASSTSVLRQLMKYPREVGLVIGLTMGGTVAFYTYTTYMQKFLVNTAGLTKVQATGISAASLFVFMVLQPLIGALSDRVGRRPILMSFGILATIATYPLLTAISHVRTTTEAFVLIVLALAIVSGYTSINAVVKAELFPAEVRALGVGLPYGIAVSLFAGTTEYIALWFKSIGHEHWFYLYVTACAAVSLIVYWAMRDTRDTSRIEMIR